MRIDWTAHCPVWPKSQVSVREEPAEDLDLAQKGRRREKRTTCRRQEGSRIESTGSMKGAGHLPLAHDSARRMRQDVESWRMTPRKAKGGSEIVQFSFLYIANIFDGAVMCVYMCWSPGSSTIGVPSQTLYPSLNIWTINTDTLIPLQIEMQ